MDRGGNNDPGGRFKRAVEKNFDESAGIYDAFEEKHRLFEDLSRRLYELLGPAEPKRVLDVGCGTGISTLSLRNAFSDPPVIYGIDISEPMLVRARARCKGLPGVYFIRGDAERLSSYLNDNFDAIFYTASIFLIPRFAESISQACGLLVPGGILAISFYAGLFDEAQNDAVARTFPDMKYNYGAVSFADLHECVSSQASFKSTEVDYRFEVGREFLFDFLSIPAQSAGLFPRIPYVQRLPMVKDFCDKMAEKVSPLFMGWKFVIARKNRS